ncbi:hypothetical protein BYT27DRAFT_7109315 [Phlegmacium glaucopus]|nr:hypothetical protein BYT27DRAFT_7109315 [Phlegmacium glaucopus]
MHPSVRYFSARAHQPLIRFLGKRTYPSSPEVPHAHPAAPLELKQKFSEFVNKIISSNPQGSQTKTSTSSQINISHYHDFWEAPSRFWKPRVRQLEDKEMDAIMSGGASSY